jgi:uncharacterized membrane protein YgaE (UPF0421/DUF939 family)
MISAAGNSSSARGRRPLPFRRPAATPPETGYAAGGPPESRRTWGGRMRGGRANRWPVLPGRSALRRTAEELWPILQQTAAAAIAWTIAVYALHRSSPFFAPIAAVVGLNATLGRRGSNAVRLLVGVFVGIVVGELAIALAGGGVWTLAVATFVSMVIARLLDGARIVIAQAAVSAILVTAFGDPGEGVNRLVEALIGAFVALAFSQLVFQPDPIRLLRRAETGVLSVVGDGLRLTARALQENDRALAEQGLTELRGLRDRLSDLATMRMASGRIVRHSVTWRSQRAPVVREREAAEHLDLLAGSCVMLTRSAMSSTEDQRRTLAPAVQQLAEATTRLAEQPGDRPTRQRAAEQALQLARWALEQEQSAATGAAAMAAVRMVALDVMVFAGVEPAQARQALQAAVPELELADPPKAPRSRRPWRARRPGR